MKITNRQLTASTAALTALGEITTLPVKPLFAVKRAISRCRAALDDFKATAEPIAARYGKMNGDGKPELDPASGRPIIGDVPGYVAAMDILLAQEIELDLKPVSAASLGEIKIAPVLLADLDWLIEDDVE